MSDERRTEGEPLGEMTMICADLLAALDAHPDGEGVQAIVMLTRGTRSGVALHGREDDMEAIAAMFMHLRAVFRANGKELMFAPLRRG